MSPRIGEQPPESSRSAARPIRLATVVARRELWGLGRLNATTTVLQRARLADPLGGMWEAADVQWWWRRPRATDELALPVWFDEVGPVAAAGLTAWDDTWQADVLAVPSRNEGMGRVIVEAMALRIPVVATAVGGIPDVVTDGECGRLVAPDDVDALAAALIELGRDDALRRKLGEAAEVRAESFSASVASEKLLAVYAALVRAKGLR